MSSGDGGGAVTAVPLSPGATESDAVGTPASAAVVSPDVDGTGSNNNRKGELDTGRRQLQQQSQIFHHRTSPISPISFASSSNSGGSPPAAAAKSTDDEYDNAVQHLKSWKKLTDRRRKLAQQRVVLEQRLYQATKGSSSYDAADVRDAQNERARKGGAGKMSADDDFPVNNGNIRQVVPVDLPKKRMSIGGNGSDKTDPPISPTVTRRKSWRSAIAMRGKNLFGVGSGSGGSRNCNVDDRSTATPVSQCSKSPDRGNSNQSSRTIESATSSTGDSNASTGSFCLGGSYTDAGAVNDNKRSAPATSDSSDSYYTGSTTTPSSGLNVSSSITGSGSSNSSVGDDRNESALPPSRLTKPRRVQPQEVPEEDDDEDGSMDGEVALIVIRKRFPMPDGKKGSYLYTGPLARLPEPSRALVPHGSRGEIRYSNGQIYRGRVHYGLRHGSGTNRWPCGQVFVGDWRNDCREGPHGSHLWFDGRHVTGSWKGGQPHGRVTMIWPCGTQYDGDCLNGKKHGRGVQSWKATGKVYSGHYKNGKEDGYGVLTEESRQDLSNTKYQTDRIASSFVPRSSPVINSDEVDGSGDADESRFLKTYRGQFKDGKRHGYGIQLWYNKTYDGEWAENALHGRGKLVWMNGACYTGHFQHGKFHGSGCFNDADGNKFVGTWKEGYKDGAGKQYFCDGGVYSGGFRKGRRNGYGRMTSADGRLYSGGWERGLRAGRGIQLDNAGNVEHCGLWEMDLPAFKEVLQSFGPKRNAIRDDTAVLLGTTTTTATMTGADILDDDELLFCYSQDDDEDEGDDVEISEFTTLFWEF